MWRAWAPTNNSWRPEPGCLSTKGQKPELEIQLNRELAGSMGVTVGQVAQALRGRGVTIHAKDCPKGLALDPARAIEVSWEAGTKAAHPVKLRVVCADKPGLLADISETYPADRGTIMGLYSVFLALGQIVGSLVGGGAAQVAGVDGLIATSIVLLAYGSGTATSVPSARR